MAFEINLWNTMVQPVGSKLPLDFGTQLDEYLHKREMCRFGTDRMWLDIDCEMQSVNFTCKRFAVSNLHCQNVTSSK